MFTQQDSFNSDAYALEVMLLQHFRIMIPLLEVSQKGLQDCLYIFRYGSSSPLDSSINFFSCGDSCFSFFWFFGIRGWNSRIYKLSTPLIHCAAKI